MFEDGKEDEVLGKIQQKLGKTKGEWDKLIRELNNKIESKKTIIFKY